MRKLLSAILILSVCVLACTPQKTQETKTKVQEGLEHVDWAKNATIYEVNIRQYTKEGTFKAFMEHMPRLKKMGVDILWLMPVHPIGEKNRKGGLGSYYSVKDYTAINPEFGTMDDFKALVNEAHELGMKVILDWVANHTSWDNAWITNNPEWYTVDSLGNMVAPFDWSDVADLNYENEEMQNEMIKSLEFWVKNADIDGYRCDVAGMVPTEFWNKARKALDKIKPVFMLAEAEQRDLQDKAFDMGYGWHFHHIMNQVSKGEKNAREVSKYFKEDKNKYSLNEWRMYFITNHDENSWNGTIFERMNDNHHMFAVLSATIPGMPLIYSGQEAGLNKRLEFFEKDEIDWSNIKFEDFYTSVNKLKKSNKALWNGADGGELVELMNSDTAKVFSFHRKVDNNEVLAIFNMSNEEAKCTVDLNEISGAFKEYFTDEKVTLTKQIELDLAPWSYKVYAR